MHSVFDPPGALAGIVLAGLLVAGCASAAEGKIPIGVDSVTRVTDVARYRLTEYLQNQGCSADIRFDVEAPDLALAFRPGMPKGSAPVLEAVNREGRLPVPVWMTRKTAGVRHIRELQGRDLATVAGPDPLGEKLPLAALQEVGAMPAPEQLYEAGDYSSALGLLLHNNTHAAVSELGFVKPLLTGNSLVVSWQGEPVQAAGWYRRNGWSQVAEACEQALANIKREDDPQVFAIFPEWVSGFALPDSQNSEDSEQ
jgi:hypothetical protein